MNWWRRRKATRAMKRLRSHYEAFGIPTSNLSDDEFEAMVMRHCKVFAEASRAAKVGFDQMAASLERASTYAHLVDGLEGDSTPLEKRIRKARAA